jgi:hypothetical protein
MGWEANGRNVGFPPIADMAAWRHHRSMASIRVMLVGVGALCAVSVLVLVPQFSHATYYGNIQSVWKIVAIAAGLICVTALSFWASRKLGKRKRS